MVPVVRAVRVTGMRGGGQGARRPALLVPVKRVGRGAGRHSAGGASGAGDSGQGARRPALLLRVGRTRHRVAPE